MQISGDFKYLDKQSVWLRKPKDLSNNLNLKKELSTLKLNEKKIITTTTDDIISAIINNNITVNSNNRGTKNKNYIKTASKTLRSLEKEVNQHSLRSIEIVYIENNKCYKIADGHTRIQFFINKCYLQASKCCYPIDVRLHRVKTHDEYLKIYNTMNIQGQHTASNNYQTMDYPAAKVIAHYSKQLKINIPSNLYNTFGYIIHNITYNKNFNTLDYYDIIQTRGQINNNNISSSLDKKYLEVKKNSKFKKSLKTWSTIANKLLSEIDMLDSKINKETCQSVKDTLRIKQKELKDILNSSGIFGLIIMDDMNGTHGLLSRNKTTLANRLIKKSTEVQKLIGSITKGSMQEKRVVERQLIKLLKT